MKILFAFENPLPSREADAEVFITTARHLVSWGVQGVLHVPLPADADAVAIAALAGMPLLRAHAPIRPAALRHLCCALTLPFRRAFRAADLVYTRNLLVAWVALLGGQRVAFDHYRPWPEQIPPLRRWVYRLMCHPRFVVNICHSDYTRDRYLALGVPAEKLHTIHNGYDPARLAARIGLAEAKAALDLPADCRTVVYTGRLNHKKGLELVLAAARLLPDIRFLLVGASGDGPIEAQARAIANISLVPWQPQDALAVYIFAADVLLIPPSWKPLATYGSTVLPLKLFFYLAAGRPILAGNTPDVREVLQHGRNAWLCPPDNVAALVVGLQTLMDDAPLATSLAAAARADSRDLTWAARAGRIGTLLAARLQAVPVAGGGWGQAQGQAWRAESWRWLRHLLHTRSFVLPPGRPAADG